ncbi:MAG: DNA polymerase III subunit gamma/tau, partial [Zoogloea sp.]|nr:DNA polymerase III subunit gamma/tau [Zoogloea sp.]
GVPFEQGALRHLAKAANGSMRDALSLLDQAIAHGAGQVVEEQVIGMLGTVGEDHLYAVLDALIGQDVNALLAVTEGMEARSLSFDAALQSLASLLHRIALVQMAPQAVTDDFERERLAPYAAGLDAEFLQLAYQIAIHGRDELPLAPDEATGFSMTLLRLFAFRPEQPAAGHPGPAAPGGHGSARHLPSPPALKPAPAAPATQPAARPPAEASPPARPVPASAAPVRQEAHAVPPWEDLLPEAGLSDAQPVQLAAQPALRKVEAEPAAVAPAAETEISMPSMPATLDWHATLRALGMGGMVRELAQHCELAGQEGDFIRLRLSHTHRHLLQINRSAPDKLQEALAAHFGRPVRIAIEVGDIATETPAQRNRAEREQRHAEAVAALEEDPFVRELFERFDATLVESSVKPFQPQEAE